MNKKNIVISVLGMMLLASLAIAAIMPRFVPPVDGNGMQLHPNYYGRSYKKLANSTTETLVCSGPCVVHGIQISSGSVTNNYIMLADTTAVNGTGTAIITLGLPGANVNSGNLLPVPFKTTIGLTIDAGVADGYTAVVFYDLL